MDKLISINYLSTTREEFFPIFSYFLKRIKPANKKIIELNFVTYHDLNTRGIKDHAEDLASAGIDVNLVPVEGHDYMDKINCIIHNPTKYSVKADDDTFTSTAVWDYWIETIPEVLEHPKALTYSPMVSNGIPTVDWYIESLFSREEADLIRKDFKKIRFPNNREGADYTSLNKHTVDNAGDFNAQAYYNSIYELAHYYKGIHPVRMSLDAQLRINDYTLNHWNEFCHPQNLAIRWSDRPYLCPQLSAIKTETWRNLVNDKSLTKDSFDEVNIHLYKNRENLRHVFIQNGYSVQALYNWVGDRAIEYKIFKYYLEKIVEMNENEN